MDYKNPLESKHKFNSKYIFIIILLISIFIKNHLVSVVSSLIPPKITNSQNITATMNQNDIYELPKKTNAYFNYGGKKAVNIEWESKNIDTSNSGIKTTFGDIDGYSTKVKFTATILPHKAFNTISDCTISNSILELNFQPPNGNRYILFKISKGLESNTLTFPLNKDQFNTKLYLPFGKGDYYIEILTSSSTKEEGTYYLWKSIKITNEDTRDLRFLLPDKNVQSDSPKIIELATSLVSGLKTDMEKTRAIHDWVASNIAYDTDAYFKNDFHEYSALDTLEGKKAICNGYANLTAALNRAVGIKTKIVGGTAWDSSRKTPTTPESHAWNETFIAERWVVQDTTWDAGAVDMKNKKFNFNLSHKYFNTNMSKFTNDHLKTSAE